MREQMREHKSQILPQRGAPQQSARKRGSPQESAQKRGSPERGATLLEVGLATALIAIALVGLSQIYASRNAFQQDQAEGEIFYSLMQNIEPRIRVSPFVADLSEGESRLLRPAELLAEGIISSSERTSFHIQGEEMEAVLFVTKAKGQSFRLVLGLAATGDWTLNDQKAEALQRFLTLASFEGGYFRAASGAGGLRPMMDPDRAMTAADRTRALWQDYADALTDQKALSRLHDSHHRTGNGALFGGGDFSPFERHENKRAGRRAKRQAEGKPRRHYRQQNHKKDKKVLYGRWRMAQPFQDAAFLQSCQKDCGGLDAGTDG